MGFGPRIYEYGDSRVPTLTQCLHDVVGAKQEKWIDIAKKVEETMQEKTGIPPNLDYPAGPAYFAIRIRAQVVYADFVMSRITGWSTHILEQFSGTTLIRPSSEYVGSELRAVPTWR